MIDTSTVNPLSVAVHIVVLRRLPLGIRVHVESTHPVCVAQRRDLAGLGLLPHVRVLGGRLPQRHLEEGRLAVGPGLALADPLVDGDAHGGDGLAGRG